MSAAATFIIMIGGAMTAMGVSLIALGIAAMLRISDARVSAQPSTLPAVSSSAVGG